MNQPEPELWVARSEGILELFTRQPTLKTVMGCEQWMAGMGDCMYLDDALLPDLKPGECRRVRLELETDHADAD